MATRKAPAKGKKTVTKKQHTPDYFPLDRSITLGVNGGSLVGNICHDTGKLLSIVNRRLYRQAKCYQVKLDLDVDITLATPTEVEVYALRNNWDVQRAVALAKQTFDDAHADERRIAGSNLARWNDFRIQNGVTTTFSDPCTYDQALALTVDDVGEHAWSSVDDAGTEKYFSLAPAVANTLNIFDEWIKSGRTSATPSTPITTVPYDGVNSDDNSDIEMANMGQDGNLPPYRETANADHWVKVATLYFRPTPDGVQRLSTGYFDAPLGLVVTKHNNSQANGSLKMTVKTGDYKGVHGTNMYQG